MPPQRVAREMGSGKVRYPSGVTLFSFPERSFADRKDEIVTLFPPRAFEMLDCGVKVGEI